MVRYIADDFLAMAKAQKIEIVELPASEMASIRSQVEAKFLNSGDAPIWERASRGEDSIHIPNGKTTINKFSGKDIVIFFESDIDLTGFQLGSFQDAALIIKELFGFVFLYNK